MVKNKKVLILMLVMVIVLLSSCNLTNQTNKEKNKDKKMVVAVSIVPQANFVKAVCGDLVEVVTMIPPGSSPENYEPTPKEIQKFSDATIYFSIGVPTEKNNIIPSVADDTKVIALQEIVSKKYPDLLIGGNRDPHIWLSPKRVMVMVNAIADEMSNIDPNNKDIYNANAKKYIEELQKVDNELKKSFDGMSNRKFIVYHPAFGYLADEYNLEMYALEEEGKEATAQRIIEMIDFAKKENIKAIFYQAEISKEQAKSFAEEIGGKTVMLSPLAEDYIDNIKDMAKTMAEV